MPEDEKPSPGTTEGDQKAGEIVEEFGSPGPEPAIRARRCTVCTWKGISAASTCGTCGGPTIRLLQVIPVADDLRFQHWEDRITMVQERGSGRAAHDYEKEVIRAHLEPLRQLQVEGETYFEVQMDDAAAVVALDALLKRLARKGAILNNYHAKDALSAVMLGVKEIKKVDPAVGVYADATGNLRLVTEPYPLLKEQQDAVAQIGSVPLHTTTAKEMADYAEFRKFYPPHEALPVMGMAAIAPFALPLRGRKVIVPFSYLLGDPGLGKTAVGLAFSEKLMGINDIAGDSINSEFRILSFLDAAGLLRTVNEAEKVGPKIFPQMKDAAERDKVGHRGQADLGMVQFRSRAVFCLTGNAISITSPGPLVRFFVIRFNSNLKTWKRSNRRAFDAVYNRLAPVGYDLSRSALASYPTLDKLVAHIAQARDEIDKHYPDIGADPRRTQGWAV